MFSTPQTFYSKKVVVVVVVVGGGYFFIQFHCKLCPVVRWKIKTCSTPSHYLNQWLPSLQTHICLTRLLCAKYHCEKYARTFLYRILFWFDSNIYSYSAGSFHRSWWYSSEFLSTNFSCMTQLHRRWIKGYWKIIETWYCGIKKITIVVLCEMFHIWPL